MEAFQTFEHHGLILPIYAYDVTPLLTPARPAPRAPGAGKFRVERLECSGDGEGLALTARVAGSGIAFIYTELLLKDPDAGRYYGPVARAHVRAAREGGTRATAHPVWDDAVEITAEIDPGLPLLTDGTAYAFCFAVPAGYGDPGRRLEGLYAPAGGATPFQAVCSFDEDGSLRGILAKKEQGRRSLPRGLTPKPGDRFTPFAQVLTPPDEDAGVGAAAGWTVAAGLSAALTWGAQRLRVVTEAPLPGDYLAGLLVQDLDGRLTREYVAVALGA